MKVFEIILISILISLILITIYYFIKQKKIVRKYKRKNKYELIEVHDDNNYYEYYEPKIVEIVSSEEYL